MKIPNAGNFKEKTGFDISRLYEDIIIEKRGESNAETFVFSGRADEFVGKSRMLDPPYSQKEIAKLKLPGQDANLLRTAVGKTLENVSGGVLKGGIANIDSLSAFGEALSGLLGTGSFSELQESLERLSAINASKQIVESSGYLYHFAPTEFRESLLKGGFRGSTAEQAKTYFYLSPTDTPRLDALWLFGGSGKKELDLYRIKIDQNMLRTMSDAPLANLGQRTAISGLMDALQMGERTSLTSATQSMLEKAEQLFESKKMIASSALTLESSAVKGVIPELFIPKAASSDLMYLDEREGPGSIERMKKQLEGRISGNVTEEMRTVLTAKELETTGRTLDFLKSTKRIGVMSPETLKNVVSSTETAIKVARGIL